MDIIKFIKIQEHSRVPKYQQIIDLIIHNISVGNFVMDQKIPSINQFSEEFYLSRDTVEKVYKILKERNIITSIRGKGYYISRTKLLSKINILFLVNKMSSYKMSIYNSFLSCIKPKAHVDLHIYHCDESIFLNLIKKYKSAYDYFVIMPHFKTEKLQHISYTKAVLNVINSIPKDKLIIMDNLKFPGKEEIIGVYQDFENDIYNALEEGLNKIKNYKKIFLVYPDRAIYPYPKRILHGFRKFCVKHKLDFEILDRIYEETILKSGDLFVTIEESDLVNLIKQIREDEFTLGKEIGVISYNDTPLKDLLGITVVSTDFKFMGEVAAQKILSKQKGLIKAPFNFIDRDSI